MMDKLRTAPLPLRRKLLLTALAGAAFFLVGLAAIFFSLDTVTALLSGILAIGLAYKTAELYRLIIAGHYHEAGCFSGLYRGWGPARAFPEELSELPYIQ